MQEIISVKYSRYHYAYLWLLNGESTAVPVLHACRDDGRKLGTKVSYVDSRQAISIFCNPEVANCAFSRLHRIICNAYHVHVNFCAELAKQIGD